MRQGNFDSASGSPTAYPFQESTCNSVARRSISSRLPGYPGQNSPCPYTRREPASWLIKSRLRTISSEFNGSSDFVSEVKPVRIASVVSLSKNISLMYASNLKFSSSAGILTTAGFHTDCHGFCPCVQRRKLTSWGHW